MFLALVYCQIWRDCLYVHHIARAKVGQLSYGIVEDLNVSTTPTAALAEPTIANDLLGLTWNSA